MVDIRIERMLKLIQLAVERSEIDAEEALADILHHYKSEYDGGTTSSTLSVDKFLTIVSEAVY